jgi:CDP-glucose 4,6-dehydratase
MENMVKEFTFERYKNKKIFITGHTGFKGTWLSIWFDLLDAEVKGYSINSKYRFYSEIKKSLKKHISIEGNINNKKKLEKEILSFQPDYIFHLAAQPLVKRSYKYPLETFNTNIIGTANLLDAVKKLKKRCNVICITTDKVYLNNNEGIAFREDDKLGGYDPYSSSKAACEIIIESYRNSFFNPSDFETHQIALASARAGNVIGGGDYSQNRIIPDIFKSLSDNKIIKIRNPQFVRPWQHVIEAINSYLILGLNLDNNPKKHSTSYNFGPDKEDILSVEELVKEAIRAWGSGGYKITGKKDFHEAPFLMLDNIKSKKELNIFPKWNAKQAISVTINWYKKSLKSDTNLLLMCIDEIKKFKK